MAHKRYENGKQSYAVDVAFLVGVMLTVIFPSIFFASYFGPVFFILFFVCSSLGAVSGLVFYLPKANSSRKKELLSVLKRQHRDFFQQIRSNVVRLLDKGETNERFFPRSS